MRKLLLLTILSIILLSGTCLAADDPQPKLLGVFIEAPVTFVNNETVRQVLPEKIKAMVPNTIAILPFDQTEMALRTYKEDNRMVVNQYYSQPVNRLDIQKIGKALNLTHALFIIINNDAPRFSAGLFSTTFKTTVTCDVRLLNIETGNYITSKQIVKDGSSTSVYMGVPSFDRAYREALLKALEEVNITSNMFI